VQQEVLTPGFASPVFDAQATFRAAMLALARPGSVHDVGRGLEPPKPLAPSSAALALALCDNDTPLWLSAGLSESSAIQSFLRFHTGVRLVVAPSQAAFAIIADPLQMPAWDDFALGTLDYPDRSTTLIVQLETLQSGSGWRLEGPGIDGAAHLSAGPFPADVLQRLADNHRLFPRGIDLLLVAGNRVAALPRTTRVTS
jgi:alpha-D-ribose 1-methylphosphonate 5-triphosphate synthase subunit PhnH